MSTPQTDYMAGVMCGCGQPAAKYSSGQPECWKCWNWRKLEAPAARYWSSAIEHLFRNANGAGPDPIDYMMWERWGMDESIENALRTLLTVKVAYDAMLADPRPWAVGS